MAAPLSQLLAVLDTSLRTALGIGAWRVLSRSPASTPVVGTVVHTISLAAVQHRSFEQPTLLIADRVSGEEEVPLVSGMLVSWPTPARQLRLSSTRVSSQCWSCLQHHHASACSCL